MNGVQLAGGDTMNYWINDFRDELLETIEAVGFPADQRQRSAHALGRAQPAARRRKILDMGPHTLVIKRGEYGAILFRRDSHFMVPGYLLEDVFDPTGAGDCFAGGFIGYLAGQGVSPSRRRSSSSRELRRAVIYGSVMGSFCCEKFGVDRFRTLTREEIDARYQEFQDLHRVLAALASCSRALALAAGRRQRRSPSSCYFATAGRSTTATPRRTSTSRAASSIRARRATIRSARCGCRCRTVLMLPLRARRSPCGAAAWRARFPPAICFVLAGMFLVRRRAAHLRFPAAAVAAAALFALNPNLLYLQSTPMTEIVFFACLLALLYFTVRFRDTQGWGAVMRRRDRRLRRAP